MGLTVLGLIIGLIIGETGWGGLTPLLSQWLAGTEGTFL